MEKTNATGVNSLQWRASETEKSQAAEQPNLAAAAAAAQAKGEIKARLINDPADALRAVCMRALRQARKPLQREMEDPASNRFIVLQVDSDDDMGTSAEVQEDKQKEKEHEREREEETQHEVSGSRYKEKRTAIDREKETAQGKDDTIDLDKDSERQRSRRPARAKEKEKVVARSTVSDFARRRVAQILGIAAMESAKQKMNGRESRRRDASSTGDTKKPCSLPKPESRLVDPVSLKDWRVGAVFHRVVNTLKGDTKMVAKASTTGDPTGDPQLAEITQRTLPSFAEDGMRIVLRSADQEDTGPGTVCWCSPLDVLFTHDTIGEFFKPFVKNRRRVKLSILDSAQELLRSQEVPKQLEVLDVVWHKDKLYVAGSCNRRLCMYRLLAIFAGDRFGLIKVRVLDKHTPALKFFSKCTTRCGGHVVEIRPGRFVGKTASSVLWRAALELFKRPAISRLFLRSLSRLPIRYEAARRRRADRSEKRCAPTADASLVSAKRSRPESPEVLDNCCLFDAVIDDDDADMLNVVTDPYMTEAIAPPPPPPPELTSPASLDTEVETEEDEPVEDDEDEKDEEEEEDEEDEEVQEDQEDVNDEDEEDDVIIVDEGSDAFIERRRLRCATPGCSFLVHEDSSFGGFCCLRCHWRHANGCKFSNKKQHGAACHRISAPDGAPQSEAEAPLTDHTGWKVVRMNSSEQVPLTPTNSVPPSPMTRMQVNSRIRVAAG